MLNELSKEMGQPAFKQWELYSSRPMLLRATPVRGSSGGLFLVDLPGWIFQQSRCRHLSKASTERGVEVLNIPQLVDIDRAGMIRAMSGATGCDPRLEDESSRRGLIEGLLTEGVATNGGKK